MIQRLIVKTSLVIGIVFFNVLSGCQAEQEKADGRYFDFASNNNSESSLELEEVLVDKKWYSNATGSHGCGTSNINGGGGISSPPYSTVAPQKSIDLIWYSWREKARMKASIKMPDNDTVNELLINPPWKKIYDSEIHRSKIIIDFRPNNRVWLKLAKSASPKSEDEVMILAVGKGVKTNDKVTEYSHFEEGIDYILDCISRRDRLEKKGFYTEPMETFNRWYPGADKVKEDISE